jgi:hypothetical protein
VIPGNAAIKKCIATLTVEEREQLQTLTRSDQASDLKLARARVLLKADAAAGGPDWLDERITEAVEVGMAISPGSACGSSNFGVGAALERRKQARPSRERNLGGQAEAKLIVLACWAPPDGRTAGTLPLLADRLFALRLVDSVSDETARWVVKKPLKR